MGLNEPPEPATLAKGLLDSTSQISDLKSNPNPKSPFGVDYWPPTDADGSHSLYSCIRGSLPVPLRNPVAAAPDSDRSCIRGRRLPAARGLGNGKIVQIVHFDTFCAFCVILCTLIHFVRNVSFCAV